MALKTLSPALPRLSPSIAFMPTDRDHRSSFRQGLAATKLYNTQQWKRLRLRVFKRDSFTCRACGRVEALTSRLVANHIKAHKGDRTLFFDINNVETVCKPCHDGPIQARERKEQHR